MKIKNKASKSDLLIHTNDEFRNKFVARLLNHQSTVEQLAEKFKRPPEVIRKNIDGLKNDHVAVFVKQSKGSGELLYSINIMPEAHNVFFISGKDDKSRTMDFGSASDIHFASVFHLPKSFYEAMKKLEDRGVTRVYVPGDIHDGTKIYKGHEVNLTAHTVEEQTDLAAVAFSKHPGLEFWGIAGNHDYSFTKQNGAKPLSILEQKVDNFKNLGDLMADVIYHGIKIRLLHGASGRVYATSYPSQTYLRDYFRGLEKSELQNTPHIILLGHYHTLYQGKDHGALVLQSGSFQDGDNEFCVRRGLTGPTGAFHVQLKYKNGDISEFNTTYIQPTAALKEKGSAFAGTTISYNSSKISA